MNFHPSKLLFALAALLVPVAAYASCPVMANQVCVITNATSNTTGSSSYNSVTYAWDSNSAAAKTETIGQICGTGPFSYPNGFTFTVKDEIGTAGTYPISVTPIGADTIDGVTQFVLNSNFESITFQCDGANNWLVE